MAFNATKQSPNRRVFLTLTGAAICATALPPGARAETSTPSRDDFSDIPYRESELGIDYHAIADFPVSHMLSQGEAEWMENAGERYGERASIFWNRFAPLIGEGRVSESIVDGLKNYSPNMLLSFARLPARHPKYGLIRAAGKLFELQQGLKRNGLLPLQKP